MRSLLLAAFLMMSGTAHPQMLGAPLVSTSAGGIVSGTNIYSKTTSVTTLYSSGNVGIGILAPNAKLDVNGAISATQLAVPGTWCGLRQLDGNYCINASTPKYTGANIACNGTAITTGCVFDSDTGMYVHVGINCTGGYTGIAVINLGTLRSMTCVKN